MARNDAIDSELEAWRNAERRQERSFDGDAKALAREVERHRDEYQRLSTEHIVEWMAGLDVADDLRAPASAERGIR
jgi:hypothetical protein